MRLLFTYKRNFYGNLMLGLFGNIYGALSWSVYLLILLYHIDWGQFIAHLKFYFYFYIQMAHCDKKEAENLVSFRLYGSFTLDFIQIRIHANLALDLFLSGLTKQRRER